MLLIYILYYDVLNYATVDYLLLHIAMISRLWLWLTLLGEKPESGGRKC